MALCQDFTGGSGLRLPLVGSALCEGLAEEKPLMGQAANQAEPCQIWSRLKRYKITFRFLGQHQKLSYSVRKVQRRSDPPGPGEEGEP